MQVRLQPELMEALDRLIVALGSDGDKMTRAEALRFALRAYMESDGLLQPNARLPRHYLVELSKHEAAALVEAVGTGHDDQVDAISLIVRDWLIAQGHLKT